MTRALDPASLTAASVEVRDAAGELVPGSASLSADGLRVIFAADAVLLTGDYTIRLSGGPNGAAPPPAGALRAASGAAALDGDNDSVAGGDAVLDFRVAAGLTRPIANPVDAETLKGEPVIIDVLANDSDPGGDALMPVLQSAPANGVAEVNPDGTVTYRPAAGFTGQDVFLYAASDGEALS
ncbi:MAG: cadherin-like domain-containing protein, partial [Rhodobacteraceae bacterium]|nr:cadherin-like domain-containing protein [Paracoccaceae bacterium]